MPSRPRGESAGLLMDRHAPLDGDVAPYRVEHKAAQRW
jgi:hypothetical protein